MLVYDLIFDYHCCYDYAVNCTKHIGFEHESSSNALFGDIITYNKGKLLNQDICFINLEGLYNKTFCFTFNQFIGTFEYMQVIGLFTLVVIQIMLTGQYMSSNTLIYFYNGRLSRWLCT